jgi:hypothetical protein
MVGEKTRSGVSTLSVLFDWKMSTSSEATHGTSELQRSLQLRSFLVFLQTRKRDTKKRKRYFYPRKATWDSTETQLSHQDIQKCRAANTTQTTTNRGRKKGQIQTTKFFAISPPIVRMLRRASWKYALLKPSPQSPALPRTLT